MCQFWSSVKGLTYHDVNLGLASLDHKHPSQTYGIVSIATCKRVTHACDEILTASPFAGANLQNLTRNTFAGKFLLRFALGNIGRQLFFALCNKACGVL